MLYKKIYKAFFNAELPEDGNETIKDEILARFSTVYLFFSIVGVLILMRLLLIIYQTPTYCLNKNVKIDFEKAIKSNCSFDDLKIIFDRKERVNISGKVFSADQFYQESTDLSMILEEMIYDSYTGSIDTVFIKQLKNFSKEYREKFPFEKLSQSQKELFLNLEKKAGDSYPLIQESILSVSEEIYSQNKVIQFYLDKSYQSYVISIVALVLTIIQVIPYFREKIKYYIQKYSDKK
ncbi:MAG TPA: hypothetical protein PLG33_01670 [Prolixibacteraceae bacterium]|nr:hypothetical protein [Prolixibacteraceae bacterium]HPR84726.1 hypothetical protein [Prolixibacteraceae bacterium]